MRIQSEANCASVMCQLANSAEGEVLQQGCWAVALRMFVYE